MMRSRILRSALTYVLAVVAMVGMAVGAVFYARSSQEGIKQTKAEAAAIAVATARLPRVAVCEVFHQTFADVRDLPGKVEAYEDIDLAAKMAGRIESLGAREGDTVSRGQALLQLDVEALRADFNRVRIEHELALQKFVRISDLYRDGVVSVDQYDDADASVKTTSATLDLARVNLEYGTLRSPIDGMIDRRYVDRGEHIKEGQAVFKIVDVDRVKVIYNVPELDVLPDAHAASGGGALYFRRGQPITVTASNGTRRDFDGVIDFVAMTADPATLTYPVQVLVDNPEPRWLRPGMIVSAAFVRRRTDEAITVPFFTMVDRKLGKTVYVIENGVAREAIVETGAYQGGMVEIVSGLEVGDILVIVGQRELVDGVAVEIARDVTDLARSHIASGGDLSQISLEMLQ